MNSSQLDRLAYSVKEAAAHLGGLHVATLYEHLAQGKLTARKLGKRTIIERSELIRYIESLPEAEIGRGS